MEEPSEEEPLEKETVEQAARAAPTDDDLRRAESSADPAVRSKAYGDALEELRRTDPKNPELRPKLEPQGWSPTAGDIERVRGELNDAKTAKSLGLDPEQYRDLARDPAHAGRIDGKTRQERDAVVAAWKTGKITGPPSRSSDPKSDFRDLKGTNGT